MKNKELFNRTISILVNAYLNDTLEHGQPCGCAIGNLVAANNGYSIQKSERSNWVFIEGARFRHAFWTEVQNYGRKREKVYMDDCYDKGVKELLSTGYNTSETLLIEAAFESPRLTENGTCIDDDSIDSTGYLGLMSVVDTLMEIHEATTEEAEAAKLLFVKP